MFQVLRTSFVGAILLCVTLFSTTVSAAGDDMTYKSIFKLKAYTRDVISGNYSFSHYGSAVLVDANHIVTNAHVILDADGVAPTGYYEVCKSENTKKVPTCFSTAKLLSYDTITDLAVLELPSSIKDISPVTLTDTKDASVASAVVVYGYPAIGGYTITRTEGKIGGSEGDKYKFDGTIDHGNSGGGAFDANGKLMGIPYAVKSDNGMIGYIIPASLVKKFLLGKTDNIQTYTEKTESNFVSYIKGIEALYKNTNLLKTKYVEIKNAGKTGFTLVNSLASNSGDIFVHQFMDTNKRVIMAAGCSRDAYTTWAGPVEYLQQKLNLPDLENVNEMLTFSGFIDTSNQKFALEYKDTKKTKGDKATLYYIFDKSAPNCSVAVFATDGLGKDKALYEKGVKLIKAIKFTNPTSVSSSFSSSFFNLKKIPKNVIVSEGSSIISASDVAPTISVLFPTGYVSASSFQILKFDDLDGYMNYGYYDDDYKGKDYSFDAFFKRYRTVGSSYITDFDTTTKDGKRLIITFKNYDDPMASPAVYEQSVVVFYPFKTQTGEYMAYSMQFTLHSRDGMDKYTIQDIISNLEFPGTSPFKN